MPQIYERPNIGAQIGAALGSGLSQGLQLLAQQKLNDLSSRQQNLKNFNAFRLLGYPEAESLALSQLPENLQKSWLVNYGPSQEMIGGQIQSPNSLISSLEAAPAMQEQNKGNLEEIIANLTPAQFAQLSQGMQTGGTPNVKLQSSKLPITAPASAAPGITSQALGQQRRLTRQQEKEQKVEDYRAKKLALEERRAGATEQAKVDKETLPVYQKINNEARSAQEDLKSLEELTDEIYKGELPSPTFASAIKTLSHGIFGLGIDLSHLLGASAERFEKLSQSFIKHAKDIFGSRVTDTDLKAFLKTIPNLSQSNEGKLAIIENMMIFNQGKLIRKQAMDEILRETGGKRPANLESLVEERAEPQLDRLAAEVRSNLTKRGPAPATQSLIGSIGRAIPRLL